MARVYRKKFDKILDKCWVSIPKGDFNEMRHHHFNGMTNPEIRNDLWSYYCAHVKEPASPWKEGLETILHDDLLYYYWSKAEYEWWLGDKKINWFDPNDEDAWQQVLDGCRPLFELFEELFGDD